MLGGASPPSTSSSPERDFEHRRRVELKHMTGSLVRRARALGVPAPAFEALYAVLKVRARSFGGLA